MTPRRTGPPCWWSTPSDPLCSRTAPPSSRTGPFVVQEDSIRGGGPTLPVVSYRRPADTHCRGHRTYVLVRPPPQRSVLVVCADESACKPDPVPGTNPGWRPSIWAHRRQVPRAINPQARASSPRTPAQTHHRERRCDLRSCSGRGLPSHPGHPGCWCALTAPFHPDRPIRGPVGGLFSVALSRESPRVAVGNRPALWSPDFPRLEA